MQAIKAYEEGYEKATRNGVEKVYYCYILAIYTGIRKNTEMHIDVIVLL